MIKNIIIPEQIDSYYFFSKRIVGIDISRNEIHASLIKASGRTRKILDLIQEKIPTNNLPYEERVITSLKNLKTHLSAYDEIDATFSSSAVVFKELILPFLSKKKIKMVVPFEIESHLPFSIDQAIVDSIITRQNKIEQKTDILAAAVKKESIEQFVKLFEAADLKVNRITVDIFELYALYLSIPSYLSSGINVLIDLGIHTTKLALIVDNQLKYIRVLPKGLINVAKRISSTLEIESIEAINQLFRYGPNGQEEQYIQESKKALNELIQELRFTIFSYLERIKSEKLNKIIVTGAGADIPSLSEIISSSIGAETEIFQAKKIMHNGKVESEVKTIPNSFLTSIAAALPSPITQDFNLNQDFVYQQEAKVVKQQLLAAAILLFSTILGFSIYSYLRVRNLKKSSEYAEKEAISELKKYFKLREPITLEQANKKAESELKTQETAWKQLSLQNRYSLLKVLSELSKCINLAKSQLNLTSVTIKDNIVQLYGSVPGYPQLVALQNQLKCPFFKPIAKIEDFNFNAEPIRLEIKQEEL